VKGATAIMLAVLAGVAVLFFALRRDDAATVAPPTVGEPTGTRTVELFFPRAGGGIAGEMREVVAGEFVEEDVRRAIEELVTAGESGIAPLPPGTRLLNVYFDGEGEVTLNFSSDLRANHPGGSDAELATIQCIVSTLGVNFPGVDRVRLLVEGEAVPTLAGHVSLRDALHVRDYRETRKAE